MDALMACAGLLQKMLTQVFALHVSALRGKHLREEEACASSRGE